MGGSRYDNVIEFNNPNHVEDEPLLPVDSEDSTPVNPNTDSIVGTEEWIDTEDIPVED